MSDNGDNGDDVPVKWKDVMRHSIVTMVALDSQLREAFDEIRRLELELVEERAVSRKLRADLATRK